MLTVYIGGDITSSKQKAEKDFVLKKEASRVHFNDVSFSPEAVAAYLGSGDIFGKSYIIFLDRILSNKEAEEFFWDNLNDFCSSTNDFILFTEKLLADRIADIKEAGGEIVNDKSIVFKKPETFNIFALADSLIARDKKQLWVLYEKALRSGKTPEEISGTLFWQLKNMMLVQEGGGQGLSPFVKSKAKRAGEKYKATEIKKLSFDLVHLYHESRRKGLGLEEKLEKFILEL